MRKNRTLYADRNLLAIEIREKAGLICSHDKLLIYNVLSIYDNIINQ